MPLHRRTSIALFKSPLFKNLFKLALVVGLMFFLVQKGFLSFEKTGQAFLEWRYSVPAMIALAVCQALGMVRWSVLLRTQKISLGSAKTAQLTLIGCFFNTALPGAVSGDLIKAVYVAKEVKGMRAKAFSSIFMDRVAGLSSLILVAAIALTLSLPLGMQTHLPKIVQLFVWSAGLGVILFFTYLFGVREHRDPLLRIFRWLETRQHRFGSVTRIYEGMREYHSKRSDLLLALGISAVIHGLMILAYVNFTWALGEEQLSPIALYVIVPLGLLVTAIPILPAGMGTGHAAFLALFHFFGSNHGADLFNMTLVFQFLVSAIGGLVYLRFRSVTPLSSLTTTAV